MYRILFLTGCLLFVGPACTSGADDEPTPEPTPTATPTSKPSDPPVSPTPTAPDTSAPLPVTDLSAGFNAAAPAIDLQWTNPEDADLSGILLVMRTGAEVSSRPQDGSSFNPQDLLSDGSMVLSVVLGTSFSLPNPPTATTVHFAAFAYDMAGNYAPADKTQINIPAPPEIGTIVISDPLSNAVVTVPIQPPSFQIAATAVYDSTADTLNMRVQLTSRRPELLFNTKMIIESNNAGTISGDARLDGKALVYFGPQAMDNGATHIRDLVIAGPLGVSNPIVLNVSLVHHPAVFIAAGWGGGINMADSAGTGLGIRISSDPFGYDPVGGDSMFKQGVLSPDGRFVYLASRNMPTVVIVDTTTMLPTVGATLALNSTNSIGAIDSLTLSPDGGTLYAVLLDNGHNRCHLDPTNDNQAQGQGGDVDVVLVKLDPNTLAELGRLVLVTADTNDARGRELTIAADGLTGALPIMNIGRLFRIDLAAMQILNADNGTFGQNGVDLTATVGTTSQPRFAAMAPDGSAAYVTFLDDGNLVSDGTIFRVDFADFSITALPPPDVRPDNRQGSLLFDARGRLFHCRKNMDIGQAAVSIYNPAGNQWIRIVAAGTQCEALAFSPDGTRYYVSRANENEVLVFNVANNLQIDSDSDSTNGTIGSLPTPLSDFGHALFISR